jgi:YggT family protein
MNLISIVSLIFNALYILFLARIILSWVRVSPYHPTWGPVVKFIYDATEPVLAPIRNIIGPMGGLDFSPILVFFGLNILRNIIIRMLIA